MSAAPKGFTSQKKEIAVDPQHTTVQPVGEQLYGLDVNAHLTVKQVATDAAEAGTSTTSIVATAHAAKRGDIIKLTSGNLSGKEVVVAAVTDVDTIRLGEALSEAPAEGDTFKILRHSKIELDASGNLPTTATIAADSITVTPSPIQYVLNGTDTEVEQSTASPSSNRPLPVNIVNTSGERGTSTIPFRIDPTGTTTQPVSAASLPLPTGAATSAKQDTAQTALDAIKTSVELIDNAISGTEMQVDVLTLPALPAGTNNIGDVDIASALPAGDNNIGNVDVLTLPALPAGDNNIGNVDIASALPAGTNNIGDVDVLTLPSLPAGANNIGSVNVSGIPTAPGRSKVNLLTLDHSSSSVATDAYTEITSGLAAEVNKLQIFDSSGEALILAVGAATSEADTLYIFPGGQGDVDLNIAAGSRLSVKSLTAATSSGRLIINCHS